MKKIQYILLISLLLWLPVVTTGIDAQGRPTPGGEKGTTGSATNGGKAKPKTLKELIAEEKARKEAEKAEAAKAAGEKPTPDPSLKGRELGKRV